MNWFGAIIVFVLASWMVFFAIASAGTQTYADRGGEGLEAGCEISAPVRAHMGRKALISMVGGVGITGIVWAMTTFGVFEFLVSIAQL